MPLSAQHVSSSEGQTIETPEYQFTPAITSVDPDVIILHDAQEEPSEALGSAEGLNETHASGQAFSVPLATTQVEPHQSTIGNLLLLSHTHPNPM